MGKPIEDFHVTLYGIEHEQYFQGHGVAFTDCATGCGATEREALEDALESLAQDGWDVDHIEATLKRDGEWPPENLYTADSLGEDCHYYVGVSVK